MDVEKEIKEKKEEQRRQTYPSWCCLPTTSSGRRFWGLILVGAGAIWLLSNLGIASVVIWPLFFIGLGLFYLSRAQSSADKNHP